MGEDNVRGAGRLALGKATTLFIARRIEQLHVTQAAELVDLADSPACPCATKRPCLRAPVPSSLCAFVPLCHHAFVPSRPCANKHSCRCALKPSALCRVTTGIPLVGLHPLHCEAFKLLSRTVLRPRASVFLNQASVVHTATTTICQVATLHQWADH